jgi:hypothetical protein
MTEECRKLSSRVQEEAALTVAHGRQLLVAKADDLIIHRLRTNSTIDYS